MEWFEGFEARHLLLPGGSIHLRTGGNPDRPALLLLHGFPQSHVMWHRVAQALRQDFFLVLPDLRGYGDSMKPPGGPGHADYSKRVMAQDMVDLMLALQHPTFFLCGHDRGARVGARLALDHPRRVRKLALVDIAPTLDMYEATDMTFARVYYHWFHLIQPAPLPEKMIGGDARSTCMPSWGAGARAASRTWSRRHWTNTNAVSAAPKRSTRPARTTAPAQASTWSTTGRAAHGCSASSATCWCCGDRKA